MAALPQETESHSFSLNGGAPVSNQLGLWKQLPYTEWTLNNQALFLTVFEADKPAIKALPDSVSYQDSISVIKGHFWLCLQSGRCEGVLGAGHLLTRALL